MEATEASRTSLAGDNATMEDLDSLFNELYVSDMRNVNITHNEDTGGKEKDVDMTNAELFAGSSGDTTSQSVNQRDVDVETTQTTEDVKVSVSRLCREADFACDRHMSEWAQSLQNTNGTYHKKTESAGAAKRGKTFEETIVAWLNSEDVPETFRGTRVNSPCTLEEIEEKINGQDQPVYFLKQELDPQNIRPQPQNFKFNKLMPDLLKIWKEGDEVHCTVIDFKSSPHCKPAHQLQVVAYACALKPEWKTRGEIWLPSSPYKLTDFDTVNGPRLECFSISSLVPFFARLCTEFTRVLNSEKDKLEWCLTQRCSSCDYLTSCRTDAVEHKSIQVLSGLTKGQRQQLASLKEDIDIEDLGKNCSFLLQGQNINSQASVSRMLCIDLKGSSLLATSYLQQRVLPRMVSTQLLSKALPELCCIAAYWDSETDLLQGFQVFFGQLFAFIATEEEFVDAMYRFMTTQLEGRMVQFCVLDRTIQTQLFRMLVRCSLEKADYAARASYILMGLSDDPLYLVTGTVKDELQGTTMLEGSTATLSTKHSEQQGEKLYRYLNNLKETDPLPRGYSDKLDDMLSDHRKKVSKSPPMLLSLCDVATTLFTIPSVGVVTTEDILAAFQCSKCSSESPSDNLLWQLKSSYELFQKFFELMPEKKRLGELHPFRLWEDTRLKTPELQQLLFIKQHERFCELRQLREERLRDLPTIRLRHLGQRKCKVLDGLEFIKVNEEESGCMGNWLCFPPTANVADFIDLECCSTFVSGCSGSLPRDVSLVDITSLDVLHDGSFVTVKVGAGSDMTVGADYTLRLRYVDFLLHKVAQTLYDLDQDHVTDDVDQKGGSLLDLLNCPGKKNPLQITTEPFVAALFQEKQEFLQKRMPYSKCLKFSPSQVQAFKRFQKNRLNLIWGPPGTGKSTYLALTLLRALLSAIYVGETRTFVVTAMTKTAMKGIVEKLYENWNLWLSLAKREFRPQGDLPPFQEICHWLLSSTKPDDLSKDLTDLPCSLIKPTSMGKLEGVNLIIGTIHQLAKIRRTCPIDLLIIDEGSQLLLADAAIAIYMLRPEGKLVIAGDHLQLPPIMKANYDKNIFAASSVLSVFRETAEKKGCLSQVVSKLEENFRSTPEISRFTA